MTYQTSPFPPAKAPSVHDGLAITSMILGILWLWWLGSLLAVIFAHVSMSHAKKANRSSSGIAVAGLVLGYVGVGTFVLFIIVTIIGAASGSGG